MIYVIRRLLYYLSIILIVLFLNLVILRLTPGMLVNPGQTPGQSTLKLRGANIDPAKLEKVYKLYTDPIPLAYISYVSQIAVLDFGISSRTGDPITPAIIEASKNSLFVIGVALLVGLVGIPLGTYAALHRGSQRDKLILSGASIFSFIPAWFLAFLASFLNLQIYFATNETFKILPIFKNQNELLSANKTLLDLWSSVLPIFLLAITFTALFCNYTRSQVLEALTQDYVRTARAKGLPTRLVIWRHIFRNSLGPLISLSSNCVIVSFTSLMLIEKASTDQVVKKGLGSLFLGAMSSREYSLALGITTFLVIFGVCLNLLADVIQAIVDPRI